MMKISQEIIVIIIALAALVYVAFRIWRSVSSRKACDCSDCPVNNCDKRMPE